MEKLLRSYVEQLKIGEEQTFKNLTMFPLVSEHHSHFAYLSLDEALIRGLVEIAEVSTHGVVPTCSSYQKIPKIWPGPAPRPYAIIAQGFAGQKDCSRNKSNME